MSTRLPPPQAADLSCPSRRKFLASSGCISDVSNISDEVRDKFQNRSVEARIFDTVYQLEPSTALTPVGSGVTTLYCRSPGSSPIVTYHRSKMPVKKRVR